jgi:hypothetical protein
MQTAGRCGVRRSIDYDHPLDWAEMVLICASTSAAP